VRGLGFEGLVICANGALLFDTTTQSIVQATPIEEAVLSRVITDMRRHIGEVTLACEMGLIFGYEPAYRSVHAIPADAVCGPAEDWIPSGVTKLLVQTDRFSCADLLARVQEVGGQDIVATRSGDDFVEISASGVTKAGMLQALTERSHRTARDVLAFGDMPNDIPMLRWARIGAAVANAHPSVLEVADVVVGANSDDGVARFLDELFPTATSPT
jgi:hydroxymethylpyrimidine pyrophosphatase-like HAD family hydrolase